MSKIIQKFNTGQSLKLKQVQTKPASLAENEKPETKASTPSLNAINRHKTSFTGLNRTLSKMAYESAEAIKAEVANFPKSKGIVGNIPKEWVLKIPKENRANIIKGLYANLNSIVNDFRTNVFFDYETTEKLNEAFVKAGLAKSSEKIKISHLDDGFYGSVFRLKGLSDDKYVIKIFKSNDEINKFHGNYTEPNRAAFWQKRVGKNTQMAPFYFADTDAGYMINKYIDKSTPKPKRNISPKIYGLKSADICKTENGKNVINGFQIDYGGIEIEDRNLIKKNGNVRHKKPRKDAMSTIQNFFQKLIDKLTKKAL